MNLEMEGAVRQTGSHHRLSEGVCNKPLSFFRAGLRVRSASMRSSFGLVAQWHAGESALPILSIQSMMRPDFSNADMLQQHLILSNKHADFSVAANVVT